jgi:hypothetical protein
VKTQFTAGTLQPGGGGVFEHLYLQENPDQQGLGISDRIYLKGNI